MSIQVKFLLERWVISNICSYLMHVCETLWSDIDGTDRKNITKINGAAPADPFSTLGTHDTFSRAPIWTFHWSWWCFSGLSHRYPTTVFRKHASNENRYLRWLIFPIKKLSCIDTNRKPHYSFSNIVKQNIIKQHFWKKKHNDCLIQPPMPPISGKTQGKKHPIDVEGKILIYMQHL